MGATCCREAENNTIAQPRDPTTKPPRGPKGTYTKSNSNIPATKSQKIFSK